jgi:hypothetical protein
MKIISKEFKPKNSDISLNIDFTNDENLYLNATKVAKQFKKDVNEWKRSKQIIEYLEALSDMGFSQNTLIKVVKGNFANKKAQGTWIHQKLVIMFSRWLSPEFAVWCDLQIEEILSSQNSQLVQTQTSHNFDIKSYTQQNRELIDLIELVTSKNGITLHYLDKLTKQLNLKSPLDLLQIDLNSYYFIPTELGKFLNKSAVEINKILEAKGFQEKINGVWVLTESGKKFAIQLENKFSTIKWKLEAIA